MLVCRRVFVPSDCFAAATMPEESDAASSAFFDDSNDPHRPALSLAVSVNTVGLLHREVSPSAFIVTIGALRVDRLGYIAEASDALAKRDDGESPAFLCPIGYR